MQMSDLGWVLPADVEPDDEFPALSELDVRAAAQSNACVLFTGGGPAVLAVARRIHYLSVWRSGPFETVSCDWPEVVVESLISRALTEAEPLSPGETPAPFGATGTLLLQDVWRLGPRLQARLADGLTWLRGDPGPRFRRWRLMASTSRPLLPQVADGSFDDRLFYRLNVIHLMLPGATLDDARSHWVPDRQR